MVLGTKWFRLLKRLYYIPLSPGYLIGVDTPVEISRKRVNSFLSSVKEGQFISTHIGYTQDMVDAVNRYGIEPLIVIRDPRAVLVSFIHYVMRERSHSLHKFMKSVPEDERLQLCLHGFF